jgi:hypothetical protein
MSFLKRLILSFFLLLFLGLPLSITYYEAAQSLPSPVDEDQPAQQRKPREHLCRRNRRRRNPANGKPSHGSPPETLHGSAF